MSVSDPRPDYDLKTRSRPTGCAALWRLATGFHLTFAGATIALGLPRDRQDRHLPAAAPLHGPRAGRPDAGRSPSR